VPFPSRFDPHEHLDRILAQAPLVLYCVDPTGVFTLREGKGLEALGSSRGAVGDNIFDLFADVPSVCENIRRALAGATFTTIVEVRDTCWEAHYSPLNDAAGALIGATCVALDVTARRRAEEEAQRNLWFLNAVVENIPDMIFVKDAAHLRFVRFNRAGEELLGYSREQLLGKSDADFFPPEEARFFVEKDRAVLAEGSLVDIPEESIHTRAKGQRTLHTKKIPIRDEAGAPLYLLGISEDITERKLVEEERQRLLERLRELDALKARLIANVSHEFRTPLTLILGAVERRLETTTAPADRADLELVTRNARVLLRLVEDLLDISKLEAGRLVPRYGEVDLARLARVTASLFEVAARERQVSLTVDAPERLEAQLDPDKVQRVLTNLLSNALKATPRAGVVRCAVTRRLDDVVVEVRDSGPGVPQALRERVFEPFFQVEATPSGGTGLGLAIVREFAAMHGGAVTVDQAPEGGARFTLVLPLRAPAGAAVAPRRELEAPAPSALAPAPAALAPSPAAPAPDDDRSLVLVVEDSAEMNRFLVDVLSRDHRVAAARDGREGLELALALRPDLVLTDLMMPRMTGGELVAAARARPELAGVPIIALTASTDEEQRLRLLREGLDDFIMKPVSIEELRARVKNLVGKKRATDVLQRELAGGRDDIEALAREVTRRKRELEAALEGARVARDVAEAASRAKGAFMNLVSHELRTPLTTMRLQLDRLEREPGPVPERQREMLRKCDRSTKHLTDLVDALLEYARVEAGRLRLSARPIDVAALLSDVVDELRPRADAKGLALGHTAQTGTFSCDLRLVRLILINLIDNAIKYTTHGRVDVAGERTRDGALRLTVSDTGMGIPTADHGRVFEPFEQLEELRYKHTPGVGLGLSLVKQLTTALGGSVSLASEVGAGSVFTVLLPELLRDDAAVASA
jgi:PAS domain S-box-containing protein